MLFLLKKFPILSCFLLRGIALVLPTQHTHGMRTLTNPFIVDAVPQARQGHWRHQVPHFFVKNPCVDFTAQCRTRIDATGEGLISLLGQIE